MLQFPVSPLFLPDLSHSATTTISFFVLLLTMGLSVGEAFLPWFARVRVNAELKETIATGQKSNFIFPLWYAIKQTTPFNWISQRRATSH